jgi:hypothetical protein
MKENFKREEVKTNNNKKTQKEILLKKIDLIKLLKDSFPNYSSNISIEQYLKNLFDITTEQLEYGVNKLMTSKQNSNFPTVYEIRKAVFEQESEIVYEYLIKLSGLKTNIEFNTKINNFIISEGGWEIFKNKIKKLNLNEFQFKYINFYESEEEL